MNVFKTEPNTGDLGVLFRWDVVSPDQMKSMLDVIRVGYSNLPINGHVNLINRAFTPFDAFTGKEIGGSRTLYQSKIVRSINMASDITKKIDDCPRALMDYSDAMFLYDDYTDTISIFKYRNYNMTLDDLDRMLILPINLKNFSEFSPSNLLAMVLSNGSLMNNGYIICLY